VAPWKRIVELRLCAGPYQAFAHQLVGGLCLLSLRLSSLSPLILYYSPIRATNFVAIGSLAAASSSASLPRHFRNAIQFKHDPTGLYTRQTQNSGEPLPEPMRTSSGFFETGTSGKMRIQTGPDASCDG
jgi:hypothetical protein